MQVVWFECRQGAVIGPADGLLAVKVFEHVHVLGGDIAADGGLHHLEVDDELVGARWARPEPSSHFQLHLSTFEG